MSSQGFPTVRLRRLRRTAGLRAMARETRVSPSQLIAPLFVRKGKNVREEISSLPGVFRLSPDTARAESEASLRLGIPAVILFGIPERKDAEGTEAWDDGAAVWTVRDAKVARAEFYAHRSEALQAVGLER